MTKVAFPFDAGAGANVTEAQWQEMARNWLGAGVIPDYLNQLEVYADSTGMIVKVKSGGAWAQGFYYRNDAEESKAIAAANATNPRIDRVVVRVDTAANTVDTLVLTGTPAATPAAPALTQTTATWDLPLAQVLVDALAGVIAAGKVTDERPFAGATTIQDQGVYTMWALA